MCALQNQNVERKIAKKFVLPKHLSPLTEQVAASDAVIEDPILEDNRVPEEEFTSETSIGSTDISSIPPILLEPGTKEDSLHAM